MLPVVSTWSANLTLEKSPRHIELVAPFSDRAYALLEDTEGHVGDLLVGVAHAAFKLNRNASTNERARLLTKCSEGIEAATNDLVDLLIQDIGKPRKAAEFEVNRSIQFIQNCSKALSSLNGETINLDSVTAGNGKIGFTQRTPYGVVVAITPFNAPLNLLVQKVVPALLMGNSVIAKPHPSGSRVAIRMAQVFHASGLPAGLFNVITGDRNIAKSLVANRLVRVLTFTGGTEAGNALAKAAGAKKLVMELGSNSANIVLADANIALAAKKIAAAAFEASGQQCISAQRVIVEAPVYDAFTEELLRATKDLKLGDPNDPATDIGPMISTVSAKRIMDIASDAITKGARAFLMPTRRDALVSPGIFLESPPDCLLWDEEVFGPLVTVNQVKNINEAVALANDSPFGLQAAVFTEGIKGALYCTQELDVGSVWINQASRFRLDNYPFGGSKNSGFGREGIRYSLEELSQTKFVGIDWS